MVVKEDGTKWACQSCLKGHRVSGCTHTDRELFFVPKKGRPITQCPHCRAERKKRSSHVKCDCGEKSHSKEKCIHLREAEAKAAAAAAAAESGIPLPPSSTSGEHHSPDLYPVAEESPSSDEHRCCCPHGGKCICSSLKESSPEDAKDHKEPIKVSPKKDTTKETSTVPTKSLSQRKPRLTSHQSEGHLTVFANGHHKPCHRNNNAAHESGAPYKLPRSHTTQSISTKNNARRSVDSLAAVASTQPHSWFQSSVSAQPSNTNSGQASPVSAITMQAEAMQQDIKSSTDVQSQYPVSSVSSSVPTSLFADFGFPSTSSVGTTTTEASMPSFSLPSSDLNMNTDFWNNFDWSKVDTTSFDVQPALTNTSSGTMSEVDEIPVAEDTTTFDNNPYSMNMQGLVGTNANNSTTNFDLDFSVPTGQSNRWSMPVYSNPNTSSIDLAAMTADTFAKPKQSPEQSMSFGQFSGFDMSSSVQSQSPAQSQFQWDPAIIDYAMGNSTDNNASLAYSVAGSSGPSMAPTAAPSPKFNADNSNINDQFFDFDNSSKLVNWNDSIMVPAGQDFLNTYNYDQNFSTNDFNSQGWSS
ncbi:hypothetical protein D6C97_02835 [Aureobasidium pullulans]|nr:hypothetical protein D6D06_07699 [Aureobasidium pullulans]THY63901.1 hypothetical protein D6C97_02835 [Aureobasidium pullulans]THZ08191.1 hypothetical protein D6C95_01723 [Aureobasidium pullulans]TIA23443.1 hypothetical protein D6C80_00742 [Aureobasidium pullulans]